MADLSKHRGTASAFLAAGVVALGVIGGATAIVGARGSGAPAAAPASSLPTTAATPQAAAPVAAQVKVHGLRKWHAAKLPKRLNLKPAIHHARKVVTVVTPVAVALTAPATAASGTRNASSKHRTVAKKTAASKHVMKPKVVAKKHASPPPPAAKPSPDPGSGSGTPPATPQPPAPPPAVDPPAPAGPPAPPAAPPPPPAVPTGTVAITGSKIAGRTVTAAWTGADPAATTYQWLLCDQDGKACQPIAGETQPTYTLKTTDIGKTIRVSVVSGAYASTSRATDQIEQGG